jgi:hypothetical protein
LQDFIVVNAGEPRSFSFQHCQDLHLNRVEFFGRSATGSSLLQISGTARLLIDDCMIFAIATENNEKLGFVFERLPSLLAHRAAFSPLASIDGNLSKAAEAIAALNPEERKKMAGEISNLIRGNDAANLSNREQTSLNQLRVLVSRESKVASLIKALDEVASALRAGTPAFALALDETADATLIDNRLRGRITLFGESDEMPDLNADQLKRLSGAIREGVVTLDDSGSLVLERNLLQGMRISGKALEKVIESAEGTLSGTTCRSSTTVSTARKTTIPASTAPSMAIRWNRKAMSACCLGIRPRLSATSPTTNSVCSQPAQTRRVSAMAR